MAKVALVTGGSRGIGEAISKGLKAAGYTVAASYAGNDEAAAKFTKETGIKTYKWDVSNYDACVAGIAKVEAKTSYEVTKSVTKGVKVTNKMVVDSKKRGYTRPMVEYRKFLIEKWREGGDCKQYYVGSMGTLTGITSAMHWAECQTKSQNGCTPKP